jgi:cobalt-zinc-cadmium efflux system outer membrane protein
LVPQRATAQEVTVDQLVAIALERAPDLRAARREIAVAGGERLQAGLRPNPDVMVSQQQPISGGTHVTTIGIEWPLDLFRRSARVTTAERSVEATTLSVRDRERMLAFAVREHAGRVLAARRNLAVMTEALNAARRMRELLEQRVTEGESPKLEANIAAVEALRVEADAAVAAGELEAATIELKGVAGLAADAPLMLRDSLDVLVRGSSNAPAVAAEAIDMRPDIREANARITLAEARLAQARSEGRFDMAVSGSYSHMRFGFDQFGLDTRGARVPIEGVFSDVTIGATMRLPFRNRNQGAIVAAEAERAGAQELFAARERAARAELGAALARDREARRAVELYASTARELARQNVDVILEAYDLGRYPLSDLLAEQRRYLDVEAAYTEMLSRAYQARIALARARGEGQ